MSFKKTLDFYIPILEYKVVLQIVQALANPVRIEILEKLRERPHHVNELSEKLGIRQPQISKHLTVLHQAGMVHSLVFAQKRIYSLVPQPLIELENWLDKFLDSPYAKSIKTNKRRKK
jgi:DNA-binding transcriptional ArsR family regulator